MKAALPVAAGQPNAALFQQQFEENKRMADTIEQMLIQQQQTAQAA